MNNPSMSMQALVVALGAAAGGVARWRVSLWLNAD